MLTQPCGNVPFLIALADSFESSKRLADANEYDNLLWDTLKRALIGLAPEIKQIFLIVDGVDEALCDQQALLIKLVSLLSGVPNMKLITLGIHGPIAGDDLGLIDITGDKVCDDISTVIVEYVEGNPIWWELSEAEKNVIIERLTETSKESFLWARLASRHACAQQSLDQFRDAIDTLIDTTPSVSDFISPILNQEHVSIEARHMLLLLAIAQRPLRSAELSILGSISINKNEVPARIMLEDHVHRVLSPFDDLVSFSDHLIYLRHGMIQEGILNISSQSKLDYYPEDPDSDFLTRLFIYLEYSIQNFGEPFFEPAIDLIDQSTINRMQEKYPLLQYALRYWPVHFQSLSASQQSRTIGHLEKITSGLPISTTFIRLLSTVLEALPRPDCLIYHEVMTDLYRKSVGDDHVVTLQCVILLASQYRQVGFIDKAISLYYEAVLLSRESLTERLLLTSQLVTIFLELTANQVTRSHTEIMRRICECSLLLIECRKLQCGDTSEEVITVVRVLAEHYRGLGEERQADEALAFIRSCRPEQASMERLENCASL